MDEEVYILTKSELKAIVATAATGIDSKVVPPSMDSLTRLELIDHCPCETCDGYGRVRTETDSAAGQSTSFLKECPVCLGAGFKGRDVVFWDKNKTVKASVQDEGRTLKLFITDRREIDSETGEIIDVN